MFKSKPFLMLSSIILGGVIVIASMIFFVGPLFEKKDPTSIGCKTTGAAHTIIIQNGSLSPEHTQAKKCDTLTIINNDTVTRLMAFGEHESHIVYSGESENNLTVGQKFTITLDKTGTYLVHDHHDENVAAYFTVSD